MSRDFDFNVLDITTQVSELCRDSLSLVSSTMLASTR